MRDYPPIWRLRMLAGVELPGGIRDLSALGPLPLPLHQRCVWVLHLELIGSAAAGLARGALLNIRACAAIGHAATLPSRVMNSRRRACGSSPGRHHRPAGGSPA